MGAIAVQCAVGEAGKKAVTELSYNFNSMAVINGIPIGANSKGLFRLNAGLKDAGTDFTSTFTLTTTDFGIENHKRMRFVYIGIDTSAPFIISVKADGQAWRDYKIIPGKTGMQTIRKSIGRNGKGRYWTFKISSTSGFRVDSIKVAYYVLPKGIVGY